MYTTTDERGILNNYAVEPSMTYAEYPTAYEQRRYAITGAVAALFVTALVLVSVVVS
jgi:hypothetical protein